MLVSFGFQLVNELRHQLVVQWSRFVDIVPLVKAPDEFVTANGDRVGSRVGDGDSADVVVVEFDQSWATLEVAKSSRHDGDHVSGVGVNVSGELGRDACGRERTDRGFPCGDKLVFHVRNGKDLLGFGVIAHAQGIDQIDTENVVVQVFADHEGAQSLSVFVGGRKCVGPVEAKVVVAGTDNVGLVVGTLSVREVLLESLQR